MKIPFFSKRMPRRMTKEERRDILLNIFGEKNEYSTFYNGVSIIFRALEFATLFALLIYLLVVAIGNLSGINYRNAEYIIRNFSLQLQNNSEAATELIYTPDADMDFAAFGEGLFVGGNTGVSIFTATGVNSCSKVCDYSDPLVSASSKYALIYENGGYRYSVYNLFSEVYYEDTEFRILGASTADNGYYALICTSDEYTASVRIYDNDFSLVSQYLFNSYVIDAELDNTGSRIIITTVETDSSGIYHASVSEYTIGADRYDERREIDGKLPLYSVYTGDSVCTLLNDRIQIKNAGSEIKEELFGSLSAADFSYSDGCAAVLLANNMGVCSSVLCMDTDGNPRRYETETQIYDIAVCGKQLIVLCEDGIYVSGGSGLKKTDFAEKYTYESVLVMCNNDSFYLCGKSSAYLIRLGKYGEQ